MVFRLNLEQLRKQAKERLRDRRTAGDDSKLSDVQYELAREHGFSSWPALVAYVQDGLAGPAASAREAVLAFLALPAVIPARVRARPAPPGARPAPRIGHGNAFDGPRFTADLETVEWLKEREFRGRYYFILGFQGDDFRPDRGPGRLEGMFRASRAASGEWRAHGHAIRPDAELPWTEPWANLAYSWSKRRFSGGGQVRGASLASVRLKFATGVVIEDDTDCGWVILDTDQEIGEQPATIELLDAAGRVLKSKEWLGPSAGRPPRSGLIA